MRSLLSSIVTLVCILVIFFLVTRSSATHSSLPPDQFATTSTQAASVQVSISATSSSRTTASTSSAVVAVRKSPAPSPPPSSVATTSPDTISRIPSPYAAPALTSDEVNTDARGALVNILCMPRGGSLSPVSGSGVLIDPRGVILTNAHVAQYVLLSEDPRINLSCTIRDGAPATARWISNVLYIPPVWVHAHAQEILDPHPSGTGEHDYALLLVSGSATNAPIASNFPFLPVDTRTAIAFPGDSVLVASYPAEFLGGLTAEYNLFPASSVTTVGQLLTFSTTSPDVLSLGGVIEAQSGSSGGAVVNPWGKLVGLIVTTSAGTTTADRDLHALALSYINADLRLQTGMDLSGLLNGNLLSELQDFTGNIAPSLLQEYIGSLSQ